MGPASAGKLLIFIRKKHSHRRTRLGCRLNAGLAEWAERHGCRESAVRTWMSVRRGPTERDRSEGIPTKEEPNQEQAPLVTWGAFPSNSPKAKRSAVRQDLSLPHRARGTSIETRLTTHRSSREEPGVVLTSILINISIPRIEPITQRRFSYVCLPLPRCYRRTNP